MGTMDGAGAWLAGYDDYLQHVVGVAEATRGRYRPLVRRFIGACFGLDAPEWAGLSVQRVAEFLRQEAASKTGHGRTAPACAVRSFLRFLAWRGAVPGGLDRAIPPIRRWQHASLPPHLSPEQLMALLEPAATPGPAARSGHPPAARAPRATRRRGHCPGAR